MNDPLMSQGYDIWTPTLRIVTPSRWRIRSAYRAASCSVSVVSAERVREPEGVESCSMGGMYRLADRYSFLVFRPKCTGSVLVRNPRLPRCLLKNLLRC